MKFVQSNLMLNHISSGSCTVQTACQALSFFHFSAWALQAKPVSPKAYYSHSHGFGTFLQISVVINKYFIKNLPGSGPCLFVHYVPCTSAVHQRPPCLLTTFLHGGWGGGGGGIYILLNLTVDSVHACLCYILHACSDM